MPANSKKVRQSAKTASGASDFEFDEEKAETAVVGEG